MQGIVREDVVKDDAEGGKDMLVPLSWLKEYVDIDVEAKELEEKLFSCGFEVEESYEVGKDISGVVVGLVEECEPIPETHLHVCKVNVGGAEPLQICCGADNVHAGGKYPVALEGAQVYATAKDHVTIEGTMKIKKASFVAMSPAVCCVPVLSWD